MDYNHPSEDFDDITQKQEKNISLADRRIKIYTKIKLREIENLKNLSNGLIKDMELVAEILPFKVNNYVIDELINWDNVPDDPIFRMTFPNKDMLIPYHYRLMKKAIKNEHRHVIKALIQHIRSELNPQPAGQIDYNIPTFKGEKLLGVQHKYRETALYFPANSQTCHTYCTFCFRWPQFVKYNCHMKFSSKNIDRFVSYLRVNPTITDVLITGGDPMVMKGSLLEKYIRPIIEAEIPHLRTIRIGSKSLSYWPYKFVNASDTETVLSLFSDVVESKLNLAFIAHFNHYKELETEALEIAVENVLETGAQIRTQSPLLKNINDSAEIWARMWKKQVDLKMIPYYMFVMRNTGAQHYFGVPLVKAWRIFKNAYSQVSGICRTARGPSMSCKPGKLNVLGESIIKGERAIILSFIQGRNPQWVNRPFFAQYNPNATWINDLKPVFSDKFFYEEELEKYLGPYNEIKRHIMKETD